MAELTVLQPYGSGIVQSTKTPKAEVSRCATRNSYYNADYFT